MAARKQGRAEEAIRAQAPRGRCPATDAHAPPSGRKTAIDLNLLIFRGRAFQIPTSWHEWRLTIVKVPRHLLRWTHPPWTCGTRPPAKIASGTRTLLFGGIHTGEREQPTSRDGSVDSATAFISCGHLLMSGTNRSGTTSTWRRCPSLTNQREGRHPPRGKFGGSAFLREKKRRAGLKRVCDLPL